MDGPPSAEQFTDFTQLWVTHNVHWAWVSSAVYVVVIFYLKLSMRDLPRFDLTPLLVLWNMCLAIFSIVAVVRSVPSYFHYSRSSLHGLICSNIALGSYEHEVIQFWVAMFAYSKIVELGDTVFIVLRKQHLIFLHWYHHITVLLYVWHSIVEGATPCTAFMIMNCIVHSFMYTYYALAALRFKVPIGVKKFITVMQLSQMVVGCLINSYSFYQKWTGSSCGQSSINLLCGSLMYLSYFLLFAKFYYDTYMKNKRPNMPDPIRLISKFADGANSVSMTEQTSFNNTESKRLYTGHG